MRRWWWLPFGAFFGLLAACPPDVVIPGKEMGVYEMRAFWEREGDQFLPPTFNECNLDEVPSEFSFRATLSRQPGTTQAWITLGPHTNEATFDGQSIESHAAAARMLDECTCAGSEVRIEERIAMALISKSQRDALGSSECPPNPLDGGVPGADGGVILPDDTPDGFDALLACGELQNTLTSTPPCLCTLPDAGQFLLGRCRTGYRLDGRRR
jgi:hypothetical protein